ncbi:MAG: hypothetical protein ACYCPN_00925 [Thermoplasmata archaeon]
MERVFDLLGTFAGNNVGAWEFITVLLLILGLFLILAGAFTAYFGSGKSRAIGAILLVVGLIIGLLSGYYYHLQYHLLGQLLWEGFLILLAAVIGALIAVGIFLVAIMKS